MDPDRSNQTARPAGPRPDDGALGALIRDVADDWQMPPQRLDEVTWRDRVGGPGPAGRPRGAGGLRWTRRLVVATALAMVATVVVSAGAVWLTAPRGSVGVASPTPSVSPSATGSTEPTPLPKLATFGELPSVTSILVNASGFPRRVDLSTGGISPEVILRSFYLTEVVPSPAGGWLCICVTSKQLTPSGPGSTTLQISLDSIDEAGNVDEGIIVRQLSGHLGPREPAATPTPATPSGGWPGVVDTRISLSRDGRLAFIGWSQYTPETAWETGVDVVDLATLETVDTVIVPVRTPTAVGASAWVRNAPAVDVSPTGDRLLVSSSWYLWSDAESIPSGDDFWTSTWDGSSAGEPTGAGSTETPACSAQGRGFIDDQRFYVSCWTGRDPVVERRDFAGAIIDRTEITGAAGSQPELMPIRDALYFWDPFDLRIDRFDLLTAERTRGQAPRPTSRLDDGPLAALARRIADGLVPSALAKILLQPALTVSPDGTRLYALGSALAGNEIGSSGIFVFDASTLESIDHWDPTADFESVAISADGRFVYAAGAPDYDPNGGPVLAPASITVYSTTDGSVRLVAGELGDRNIWFREPVLR